METSAPPHTTIDLSTSLYYQLVYTLTDLLPPPLDDTQEGLRARNHAAIAKIASLLPVNANEADLAAQCIAARAQAEDILRLLRQHAGDIHLIIRLNAQYASMVRTSLSAHARLMRVQAVRQKRESVESTATQDTWTQHIAEQSMLTVTDPKPGSPRPAFPEPPKPASPEPIHPGWFEPLPPAHDTQIPQTETNSHNTAFETRMSAIPRNEVPKGSGEMDPNDLARELLARSLLAGRELPANGRETPGRADPPGQIDGKDSARLSRSAAPNPPFRVDHRPMAAAPP